MKHLILTLLLVLASAVGANAQNKFYEACKGQDGIETVYIGKAMLQMVKGRDLAIKEIDLNAVIDKIDAIIVVNTDSKAKKLRKLAAEFSSSKGYEILVDTAEKDESVSILYKKTGKDTGEYVIKADDEKNNDMSVIIITGSLTPEDIIALKHKKQS